MKADDYTKVFWLLKHILDNDAHYVEPKRRVSLCNSMKAALEIRDKKRVEEEAVAFRTCPHCKQQIDMRTDTWLPQGEDVVHRQCPVLKPEEQRDENNFY